MYKVKIGKEIGECLRQGASTAKWKATAKVLFGKFDPKTAAVRNNEINYPLPPRSVPLASAPALLSTKGFYTGHELKLAKVAESNKMNKSVMTLRIS